MNGWSWLGISFWLFGGATFIAFETLGMLHSNDQFPTFTNVIKKYVPKWAIAMCLGWLSFHFLSGKGGTR